jgi:hypothetical protein
VDLAVQGERARKLKRLSQHEGWAELRKVFDEERDRYAAQIARKLLRKDHEFDQRDADWKAGYFAAWEAILDNPAKTEVKLERALRADHESR